VREKYAFDLKQALDKNTEYGIQETARPPAAEGPV
jgi:hypothetical protein